MAESLIKLCKDINDELWYASRYCCTNGKEIYGKELQRKYYEFKKRLDTIIGKEIRGLTSEIDKLKKNLNNLTYITEVK